MALNGDAYGSIAEVLTYTRPFLNGEPTFNALTRPTLTEVEGIINRASRVVNAALSGAGFTTPINSTTANSTAKALVDDWVIMQAVAQIELTARGSGFDDSEGTRAGTFAGMAGMATSFAREYRLALERAGATVTHPRGEGVSFTGLDIQSDRADPDDTTLEQPKFTRGQFDHPET